MRIQSPTVDAAQRFSESRTEGLREMPHSHHHEHSHAANVSVSKPGQLSRCPSTDVSGNTIRRRSGTFSDYLEFERPLSQTC